MNFPVIDTARTGARIADLRKAAGLSVHDLQMVFGFNSPQAIRQPDRPRSRAAGAD